MPRSKNPNPRQVTDGEVNGEPGNEAQTQELQTDDVNENGEPEQTHIKSVDDSPQSPDPNNASPPIDYEDWSQNASISPTYGDTDRESPAASAISALEFAGMPVDLSEDNLTDPQPAASSLQVALYSRPTDTKRSRNQVANALNPQVMIWMRNRFEMGSGGKISASDISNLYRTDTEHMETPPPALQNYQVGQLLRRVFPEITRCKITVNGRRYWVYKHLNLVQNPPENLFEDRHIQTTDLEGLDGQVISMHDADAVHASRTSISMVDDTYREGEDNEMAKVNMANPTFSDDKAKNNAMLLGLLAREQPSTSPVEEPASSFQNGIGMGKKKRDCEVIDWLKASYKFKPGYYVKSMDLLRKYNNGRVEIVKYLSQVGRVMKHVFPDVRHLRKSFKGGKREWVYLNLKPMDVDSDSEEGRSMVMPTMRRATGWYQGLESSSFDIPKNSSGWKRERVDISHAPLSLVQADSVFQANRYPKDGTAGGRKNAYDDVPSLLQWAKQQGYGNENESEFVSLESDLVNGTKNREGDSISTADKMKESSDIERDIFAPFTQIGGSKPDEYDMACKRAKLTPHSSVTARIAPPNVVVRGNASSKLTLLSKSSSAVPEEDAASETISPALDLTVKAPVNSSSSFREKLNHVLSMSGSPITNTIPDLVSQDVPATKAPFVVTSTPVVSTNRGNHPTIHYRPPRMHNSGANFIRNKPESPSSSSQQFQSTNSAIEENLLSWLTLQAFSAKCYGWMRSPIAPHQGDKDGKQSRFLEWFSFCGQTLVNRQRALKEVKIYDDWTVEIYALGRRVLPNNLGGITDLEKTPESLNKVFRVLAEAKICTGFPAPSVNDLYIHGILVSRCEVWTSRDDNNEDLRQRAVNCQIMYSGPDACCSKCTRIMMLQQQPGKSFLPGNRNSQDSTNSDGRIKSERA